MTWINCRAVGRGRRCSCAASSCHIAKDINPGTARSQSAIGGVFMTLWTTVNWLRTATKGRFDPLAMSSGDDRYVRKAAEQISGQG